MKKRMHLKRRKKKIKFLFLIPTILLILALLLIIKYINIKPLIINYSEMEANKLSTLIINTAIKEENIKELEKLYEVNNGIINYDTKKINDILTSLTLRIQNCFSAIENGNVDNIGEEILGKYNYENLKEGTILYIPMGYLTGSSFLANIGPKLPLKITLIGDIRTDIKERITDYGLNNALLKIYIYVEVVTQSIVPLVSSIQKTVVEYPVVLKIIEGQVPTYYVGNR